MALSNRTVTTDLARDDKLTVADRQFASRLFLGTGKYRGDQETLAAIAASGCEMITVAIKRLDLDDPSKPSLIDLIDWNKYKILPNTAGCRSADEAVMTAKLAREATGSSWIKLEVIAEERYLLPDPVGTLEAARKLTREGFTVLPYINADPILALRLQDVGCATVMPLGSPIGSGRGALTLDAIAIMVEQTDVPVVVDAGLGAPSDAAKVMEIGAAAVLVNTAIARADKPDLMAAGFKRAAEAGRLGYLARRAAPSLTARASSPIDEAARL